MNESFAAQLRNLGLADATTVEEGSTVTWDFDVAATPLQRLKNGMCPTNGERRKLLESAVKADKSADKLYEALCDRTTQLAQEMITVDFSWRLRVAGFRGFQELLLPAFHPIYGVPYIPASSLKGMLRIWALKTLPASAHPTAERLLGYLKEEHASLAAVQILDAFPTKHCLSLDIANPLWSWEPSQQQVKYDPVPHPMLSLLRPQFKIGLQQTCIGNAEDVSTCRRWLEQALQSEGVGGRTSAGYGRTQCIDTPSQQPLPSPLQQRYQRSEHRFELWTEGIHGSNPKDHEMRPVALRGLLRYWFRAITLGLYPPKIAQELERDFFGSIDGESPTEGYIRLALDLSTPQHQSYSESPFHEAGKIILESKHKEALKVLNVAQQILKLATHLGAIGRGARRPLHWNRPRFRGGYLQLLNQDDILRCNADDWQELFNALKDNLNHWQPILSAPSTLSPGTPHHRLQDVINNNAAIYLLPHRRLKHPRDVNHWHQEGNTPRVRGSALEFLYQREYKGFNGNSGNRLVGGELGTPSFVWITSNCLHQPEDAYQTITTFGIDNPKRAEFINALYEKFNTRGLIRLNFTQ